MSEAPRSAPPAGSSADAGVGGGGGTGRARSPVLAIVVVGFLLVFPQLPFVPFSVVGVSVQAGQFVIVTASLVMLTGWVGQISLAHAALVGIGGYATGWAVGGWGLPFPLNIILAGLMAGAAAALLGGVALRVRGLFLAVATLIFSWMADAFLFRVDAVVRHAFIEVPVVGGADAFPRFDLTDRTTMFYVTWGVALGVLMMVANLRDSKTGRAFFAVRGSEIGAASLGIDVTRYKLVAFTFSGFLAGVSGSLVMLDARSLSPETFDFATSLFYLAMAVVGGLSSLGGAVASAVLFAGLNELFFRIPALGNALDLVSAALLAIVLLLYRGGLASVPGMARRGWARAREVVGAALPRGTDEPEVARAAIPAEPAPQTPYRPAVARVPVELAGRIRDNVADLARRLRPGASDEADAGLDSDSHQLRRPTLVDEDGESVEPRPRAELHVVDTEAQADDEPAGPQPERSADGELDLDRGKVPDAPVGPPRVVLPPDRRDRTPMLEAEGITVRFGGLVAVNDASLTVREHEIAGLIGPNGAGKTTLFNAIAGLNRPTEGRVRLFGEEVTSLPVHQRARLGVARTFQAIQLFPQLTVFENLLVATHVHNDTGFFRHLFVADSSVETDRRMRDRVTQVIEELFLTDVAYRPVADLPFGVLRMVEVARTMVTGFPLVMLDEPASGLDNTETDRLADMLREIRAQGVTLLLIEHDVRMVTGVSDYMYVLNRGEIIAEGPPDEVQEDEAVMAAYLGQPEDAAAATHGASRSAGMSS